MPSNSTNKTTDYGQFKLMDNNREQNRSHIEALKRAFSDSGNLTIVQPILVNDRFEIIDGQHRFLAAKELEEPIYYTVRPGLTIDDARSMNILHRSWHTDDYARSYANSGNRQYIEYLKLVEDYGFSHSVTVAAVYGSEHKGAFVRFRNGELEIEDLAATKERLERLAEVQEVFGRMDRPLAYALIKTFTVVGYNHKRMMDKLVRYGEQKVRHYASVPEYQRALEEVYNQSHAEGTRLRLY